MNKHIVSIAVANATTVAVKELDKYFRLKNPDVVNDEFCTKLQSAIMELLIAHGLRTHDR